MTDTEPDGEEFGDEGAGPEEPAEVVADPENQAAAAAIRDSTLEGASTFGDMAEGEAPTVESEWPEEVPWPENAGPD